MTNESQFSDRDMSQISTYHSGVAQATAHRVTNRVVSEYLKQYGLSGMQWFILGYVYDSGSAGMTIGDLRRVLETTLPYTTNAVASLEAKGFVNKQPRAEDNRIKVVTIDERHHAMIEEIESGLREELRRTLYGRDDISREDLSAYIRVLYKIIGQ